MSISNRQTMFPTCITTSTAGMSVNSPPATDRECHYDQEIGEECDNYYTVDCEPQQPMFNKMKTKMRGSYMNI